LVGVGRFESASSGATFAIDDRAVAYVYCGEVAEAGYDLHAGIFAPGIGIPEDPATVVDRPSYCVIQSAAAPNPYS
jgi:hypothetical protein